MTIFFIKNTIELIYFTNPPPTEKSNFSRKPDQTNLRESAYYISAVTKFNRSSATRARH